MKSKIILIGIVILASLLRLYSISTNPPSLSWDEVSIGYNAYSILLTGKDEHGRFLPLDTFTAYGDYKPPIPIYLTVPFVALLGLNELTVRLPSALAGIVSVLLSYFIVLELFSGQKNKLTLATVTSILFAVSPWHINLSRAGFEANIAVFFVLLGVLLLFRSRVNTKLLFIAWIPFVAAIYTFNSSRYFVPIFGIGILLFLKIQYKNNIKPLISGWIIASVLMLPIIGHLFSPEAMLRFKEVNIFNDLDIVLTANNRMSLDGNAWWSNIFHNRRIGYARSYMTHFLDHFQPWFLFLKGDGNPKFSIQDVGQLYAVEAPFLLMGLYWLFSTDARLASFLLFWIITSIIPAAVARETPHALRIENSLPVWQMFIAYGLVEFIRQSRGSKSFRVMIIVIVLAFAGNVTYYLHNYYSHYPREFSGEWQYGYKQAFEKIQPIEDTYDRVYIGDSIGRPYMYFLFYRKVDPRVFWNDNDSWFDEAGFYHVDRIGKYYFIRDEASVFEPNSLYILSPKGSYKYSNRLETIRKLNGEPTLIVSDSL